MTQLIHNQAKIKLHQAYADRAQPHQHTIHLDLASGPVAYAYPQHVEEALNKLTLRDLTQYSSYPSPHQDLVNQIQIHLGTRNFTDENIFFGFGAAAILERLFWCAFPKSRMLSVGPHFTYATKHCLASGGSCHTLARDLNAAEFPLEALLELLASPLQKFNLVYLDNPNNPLGSVLQLSEVRKILDVASKHGQTVIIDEAYGDYLNSDLSAAQLVKDYDNLVVLRGFSKFFQLAGVRMGYALLSSVLAPVYADVAPPFEPQSFAFNLARTALMNQSYIQKTRQTVREMKIRLTEVLRQTRCQMLASSTDTNIATLFLDKKNLALEFLKYGIHVHSGSGFNATHSALNENYARLLVPQSVDHVELIANVLRAL